MCQLCWQKTFGAFYVSIQSSICKTNALWFQTLCNNYRKCSVVLSSHHHYSTCKLTVAKYVLPNSLSITVYMCQEKNMAVQRFAWLKSPVIHPVSFVARRQPHNLRQMYTLPRNQGKYNIMVHISWKFLIMLKSFCDGHVIFCQYQYICS